MGAPGTDAVRTGRQAIDQLSMGAARRNGKKNIGAGVVWGCAERRAARERLDASTGKLDQRSARCVNNLN